MAKVFLLGLMADAMKVNTMMIRNKDMAFSLGQMEGNTKDNGLTESNMVLEHIKQAKEKLKRENGKKVKE